jgi:hypothetical protein
VSLSETQLSVCVLFRKSHFKERSEPVRGYLSEYLVSTCFLAESASFDVRYWRQSGRAQSAVAMTAFDPKQN